ncbi:MAG: hypothetical protein IPK05_09980 [Comamonadaceae bacterium]|nr:hypothetical protein [Comamonadaceae bacterium]
MSAPTARKWLRRYPAMGCDGLTDASSRPRCRPERFCRQGAGHRGAAPDDLRRRVLLQHWGCREHGFAGAARAGLSRLSDCNLPSRSLRYERWKAGQMCTSTQEALRRIGRPSNSYRQPA